MFMISGLGHLSFYSYYSVIDIVLFFFFFFQAEDGIRDLTVTGVQTCALPILWHRADSFIVEAKPSDAAAHASFGFRARYRARSIGRSFEPGRSCRQAWKRLDRKSVV